jgi:hypothetical protein
MFVAIVLAIVLGQGSDARVVTDLEEFEQRLAVTWQQGDCEAWGALLAPGWSVIHITGDVITKEQALQMCRAPRPAPAVMKIDDVSVRVFGDAAVVTGRTTGGTAGQPAALVLRFTDVFVRSAGRWLVVASQATRLPPKELKDAVSPL